MFFKSFCNGRRTSSFGKRTVLAVLLVALGSAFVIGTYKNFVGHDFYQYWGVGLGPKMSGGYLKSPYAEVPKYSAFLDVLASRAEDRRLFSANKTGHALYPEGLDIPGTPLLYELFSVMPQDYSRAFGIFLATQTILFICAVTLFFPCDEKKRTLLMLIAAVLIPCYLPLQANMVYGNLNATQFFSLGALAAFANKFLKNKTARPHFAWDAAYMSALVLLTLIKPNIVLVTLILSASFWRARGAASFFSSAAVAGALGAALAVIPCVYFGSWTVWVDWYRSLPDVKEKTAYAVMHGNGSTSLILSDLLNINIHAIMALIVFFLALHGLWALLETKPEKEPVLKYIKPRIALLLEDPYLCASLAITVTLAASPLVWSHYYVLALFPAFWLIAASPAWSVAGFWGVIALIVSSGAFARLLGEKGLVLYTIFLGWIPLWFGMQAAIADRIRNAVIAGEYMNNPE
jgi:hypothetical protein